jgi:hypothetical protein
MKGLKPIPYKSELPAGAKARFSLQGFFGTAEAMP